MRKCLCIVNWQSEKEWEKKNGSNNGNNEKDIQNIQLQTLYTWLRYFGSVDENRLTVIVFVDIFLHRYQIE